MNIILFGPPAAGKGTQAQLIVKKYNYFQLSTGDLLRKEAQKKSELGLKIESLISKGNFVPDEIVNQILEKTILGLKYKDRIIFDGYPRTIDQAKNLDGILKNFNQKIDLVISLSVPREIVEKRIIGRVTCQKCNVTLNEFFNSKEIELHPCGSDKFIKRKDDTVSTVLSRYDIYINTTQPVIEYLSNKIDFYEIDGTLKIKEITAKIDDILNV